MALFHFHVGQIKRSEGHTAVAAAAYRAGDKLHCDYYGEEHDYTRKGGIVFSEIILPPQAPRDYADRQTLWNAVETIEKHPKAQLAYSFDIALQNEISLDENIVLARQFIQSNFVDRGMLVDWAVHEPDKGKGVIPNPHFHVLAPIRPILDNGRWGNKQFREYKLDENSVRIRKANGEYDYNAIPTTDWGSPETLTAWRKNWADLVNAKFEEKGLECRIDHRSYKDIGLDIIPQVHEGSAVHRMEEKGIVTEKGELNRWIRETNKLMCEIIGLIKHLSEWYHDAKEELQKLKEPTVMMLVNEFYDHRDTAAETFTRGRQKAKGKNLKKRAEICSYLQENQIVKPEELGGVIEEKRNAVSSIKAQMDKKAGRMKELQEIYDMAVTYKKYEPIYKKSTSIFFKGAKKKYQTEHKKELDQYHMAARILKGKAPDADLEQRKKQWRSEFEVLKAAYGQLSEQYMPLKEELSELEWIRKAVDYALEQRKSGGQPTAMENSKRAAISGKTDAQEEKHVPQPQQRVSVRQKLEEKKKIVEQRKQEQQGHKKRKNHDMEL